MTAHIHIVDVIMNEKTQEHSIPISKNNNITHNNILILCKTTNIKNKRFTYFLILVLWKIGCILGLIYTRLMCIIQTALQIMHAGKLILKWQSL